LRVGNCRGKPDGDPQYFASTIVVSDTLHDIPTQNPRPPRLRSGPPQDLPIPRSRFKSAYSREQTGATFSKKAGALRKAFDRIGIDLLFPTAPHKILPADAPNPNEREKLDAALQTGERDWKYWAWGFADEEKRVMRGIDESVEFIGKIMREEVRT
jgi:Serine hydrolase (FSH1)